MTSATRIAQASVVDLTSSVRPRSSYQVRSAVLKSATSITPPRVSVGGDSGGFDGYAGRFVDDVGKRPDETRMRVQRFDALEPHTGLLGLLTSGDLDVVQDLEVVGEELDRRDDDRPMPFARERGHQVGKVRLHPFARLVPCALPAERPPRAIDAGAVRDLGRRRRELVEIIALVLGDPAGQAVGRQQDRGAGSLVLRQPRDRLADTIRDGIEERGTHVPGSRDGDVRGTFAKLRPPGPDVARVAAHEEWRVLRREDDPDHV